MTRYTSFVNETLRDRQKRMARELILQAAADEVVEHGVVGFSLQAVAARAGVSSRTLYNYFESRETLMRELTIWSDEVLARQGGYFVPDGSARVSDYARTNFLAWSAQGNLMKALVQLDLQAAADGRRVDPGGGSARRVDGIEEDVRRLQPGLERHQSQAIAHVLRSIISSRTWYRLTVENGLEVEPVADAVAWAYGTLREAVASGGSPFPVGGELESLI